LIEGCKTAGIGCLDCKEILLEHLWGAMEEIHAKRQELAASPKRIDEILEEGSLRARHEAVRTLSQIKEAVGI
jgi:tryptophanyl-tRNA synthetase